MSLENDDGKSILFNKGKVDIWNGSKWGSIRAKRPVYVDEKDLEKIHNVINNCNPAKKEFIPLEVIS